jgi:hypothetical protein
LFQRIREDEYRLDRRSRCSKVCVPASPLEKLAQIQGTHATTATADTLREWLDLNERTRARYVTTDDFLDAYAYQGAPVSISAPTPTTGWVSAQAEDRVQRYRELYHSQYYTTPLYHEITIHADNEQEARDTRPPRRPMNLPEEARLRINGHPRRHRG